MIMHEPGSGPMSNAASFRDFVARERLRQSAFVARHIPADAVSDHSPYRLRPGFEHLNLAPATRDEATLY